MRKIFTSLFLGVFVLSFCLAGTSWSQSSIFVDDFESGTASTDWGVYRADEENVVSLPMAAAPTALEGGGEYLGYIHDIDNTYNGAAIILGGETTLQNYSIEGDVYCYVNHSGGSAYTGLVVYGDSSQSTYIKLVADFDGSQRLRFYNNHLNMTTMQYTFHHQFGASDIAGGIPTEDGWHHMKVEVKTISEDTTAFWCYFDGALLTGCPIYDTSVHQMDSGQFGIYAFQMDGDGIAGYFDNIDVKPLVSTIFEDNFESGIASTDWGVYRADEENVVSLPMAAAPTALEGGGDYLGYIQDLDNTYNGAAIILGGETTLQNYSIEGDVYCYVNHPGGSAYTGLVVYGDSSQSTYIKLVADFDGSQRLRFYNNHLNMTTMQYTFHHQFGASDIAGGIPTEDGWHHMKVEVQTVDESTTAFWCYFDGALLNGCPIYDTSVHQMDSGQFGLYAFQMDGDGIAGYFDNIVVQPFESPTAVDEKQDFVSPSIVKEFRLGQNYPNPFNPVTHISYQIVSNEYVTLTIYDLLGKKIKSLISENQMPGSYSVTWNGRNEQGNRTPSGVYVYTLKTNSFMETKKMLMLK